MIVYARSDKKAKPTPIDVILLTWDELKAIKSGQHIDVLDQRGKIATTKVTSVKTWKRRPTDLDIHYKYGMYDYGVIYVRNQQPDMRIVKRMEDGQ